MATVKEIEQFNVRLSPDQKQRLERLARASGISLNEYIGQLIDSQYESESETIEKIETLRLSLTNAKPERKKVAARH